MPKRPPEPGDLIVLFHTTNPLHHDIRQQQGVVTSGAREGILLARFGTENYRLVAGVDHISIRLAACDAIFEPCSTGCEGCGALPFEDCDQDCPAARTDPDGHRPGCHHRLLPTGVPSVP
jgi:hypothetical protein